ncbi:MAG: fumarate hydratase [Oscillospiraceae bacterium]|nr:fumarate hydratase [Oscillospiraceae bacterium]
MREINASLITETVSRLCIEANLHLPCGMKECIASCIDKEESPLGKSVLSDIISNIDCADELSVPICQDTGMAVIFAEVGQDCHITGGLFEDAVNAGVADGYIKGRLRLSIVGDPLLDRKNTNNNTPAVIHTRIVEGDRISLTVAPKGFGSENMSRLKMFTPSASREDIIGFVTETVSLAGSNPCPPIVVGVGIGGDFEYSAYLAKKALCRDLSQRNPDPAYARMEQDMLQEINRLGIGSQGFGGTVTALYVNIEKSATHIAGLPVAVNIGCHVTRHAHAEI